MKKKRGLSDIVVILVFFLGLAIFTYPFVANAVNDLGNTLRLRHDRKQAAENAAKQAAAQKRRNAELRAGGWRPNAAALKKRSRTDKAAAYRAKHLIGTVEMPSISSHTLLFDRTNETLLRAGATVLTGTSYPTGGKGNHTVLTSHSGIPGKQLFSKLEKMRSGDVFVITVGKKKLAYEVDQLRTIRPEDVAALRVEPGRDLATLMTCTPIGINSHRFLVTGHRVPYTAKVAKQVAAANRRRQWWHIALLAAAVLAVVLAGWLLRRTWRKRRAA